MTENIPSILALAGGVGGARLADGLNRLLGERLTVVVNTGDDFEHLGLHISPDLDTVMYNLAGVADTSQGWGRAGETWTFMEEVGQRNGPTWFRLGDKDLAIHCLRTSRLKHGDRLTDITADLCQSFGVRARLMPMSDDPIRTMVRSGETTYAFQDYFVRLRCNVPVTEITYDGTATARPNPDILALANAPAAIIICPSNPYLSIAPILAVPEMRDWIGALNVPVVAVSPIIAGEAVKGPAAKIMRELGFVSSSATIAAFYRGLVDGLVIDEADADLASEIEGAGTKVLVTPTVMRSPEDRVRLARDCIDFAASLAYRSRPRDSINSV